MRVLLAGASGAIGTRLVSQLVDRGHEVIGTSRSPDRAERLHALGAEPIVLDLLDPRAVRTAVFDTKPDAIVHQATALAGLSDFKHFDRSFAQTNRLRTDGTDALLAAAQQARVGRLVAQSFANHRYARQGGPVKTEQDPLDPSPVPTMRETEAAMAYLDQAVTDAGGIALRYGNFYGDPDDGLVQAVRSRSFPIVGDGGGVWSFLHLDDAAAATVLALERGAAGIYNVVDDEPAPTRVWLPELARIVGAKPPQRFPRWLARLFAGQAPVVMATESRGASNAKAKRELGWTLRYPSWREGFVDAYT
jgi:2-alkyl-3-oxoalkanoate reductase